MVSLVSAVSGLSIVVSWFGKTDSGFRADGYSPEQARLCMLKTVE
ncbi:MULTISPECIES: hypothetical protein [Agrobacterium]|nr:MULTISPECIES: hypothetical protein [Agrobacterium]